MKEAQIIMSLFQNCPIQTQLTKSIKDPTRRQRVGFRVKVMDVCDFCFAQQYKRNSGRIADTMLEEAKALTDENVAAITFDATNPDFVVI